jgi:D-lactate dehydrogenase
VRDGNFRLDGLVGYDLAGKTVGVIGTGRIGAVFARIMRGFGCRVLAFDLSPDPSLPVEAASPTSISTRSSASRTSCRCTSR